MKKIFTILVSVLIIAMSGFYIYSKKLLLQNKEGEKNQITKQEEIKKEVMQEAQTKEIKLGDMVLSIPESLIIEDLTEKNITVNIPGIFAENNELDQKIQVKQKRFMLFFDKNSNKDKLSLKDWSDNYGPQTEPHSQIAINEKYIKINNFDAYLTLYSYPRYVYDIEYYDREQTYLSNKTDIYEIRNYRRADPKNIFLTPEEIKSIENYEKIVDQIIKSIRFVN